MSLVILTAVFKGSSASNNFKVRKVLASKATSFSALGLSKA